MPKFERNDLALIKKQIDQEVAHPKIGRVTQVYEHGAPDDDSNFEVDVEIDGGTAKESDCPVLNPGTGSIDIPEVGDKVLIIYTEEATKKPYAINTAWTNKDRPPIGKAGMWRKEFKSDTSPLGDGNLYVSGYTQYDKEPAIYNEGEREVEKSLVQIAKHTESENLNPNEQPELPAKIELYDSPKDGESHIHIDGNVVDEDENLGMDMEFDFKKGTIKVRAENDNDGDVYEFEIDVKSQTAKIIGDSNSGNKMGASFNFNSDEFKIADGNKFGIKSDGAGNFIWSHKDITFDEESSSTGSINL